MRWRLKYNDLVAEWQFYLKIAFQTLSTQFQKRLTDHNGFQFVLEITKLKAHFLNKPIRLIPYPNFVLNYL
jgi:hypothetical protein